MNLKERINKGLLGKYEGLSNGLKSINEFIFSIQRSTMYLLGGMSGTYKTTLADFMLLHAIDDAEAKGIKLDIFYYSYEIDELTKKCNWLSVLIFKKYGRVISPEKIKGLGSNRLDSDEQEIVNSEIDNVEELFKKIKFRFTATNPTGIYHEIWEHAEKNGTILWENYKNGDNVEKKRVVGYKANDEEAYTIVVLDHLYHLKKEREFSTKEVIDKYSEYCVALRNTFGVTFLNIQQFNDGLSSIERLKFKAADISPQMTDFRDTRNVYMDSDIVLGTMCPYKMDLDMCLGYEVGKMKANMIMLKVIKNRLSKDSVAVGVYCNPKAGSFIELPALTYMTENIYNQIRSGTYNG